MRRLVRCVVIGVLSYLVLSSPVLGQSAGDRADPGRIERRIEDIQETLPRPDVAPPALPTAPEPERPSEAELSFLLSAVVFEGNTRFPASDFIPFYEDFLLQHIGRKEVEAIASAVTEYYRSRGYLLSWAEVPAQSVSAGVLRVRVIEGHVTRTILAESFSENQAIARFVSEIEAERPLSRQTLEKYLLLIEDLPGVTIERSTLSSTDQPGQFVLSVTGREDRLDGGAYLDNRGTPESGRWQALLVAGENNTLGLGEHLELDFFTVPNEPAELLYFGVRSSLPVGSLGTMVFLDASQSFQEPGASLEDVNSEGDATRIKSGLKHPVIRKREFSLWVGSSFEIINVDEDRNNSAFVRDRLRVVRGSIELRARDEWAGSTLAEFEVSRGLDIIGASDEGDPTLSRDDGDPDFTKLAVDVTRIQKIYGPVQLRAAASGQIARNPLLSSEEFDLGGSQFGRAYDFSELSGDHGLAGSLELRLNSEETDLGRFQLYSFIDGGAVWQKGSSDSDELVSAGAGVRWLLLERLNLGLELAQPINRDVDSTGDRDLRVLFSVAARY